MSNESGGQANSLHGGKLEPILLDVRDARIILGNIGRTTFYNLVNKNKLKVVKIGSKTTVTYDSVKSCARDLLGIEAR
jgi:hypothetical protein